MLNYIMIAQIIGCVLVIFGHSYPFVSFVPQWLWDVQKFIYTFHMPLFVFCSGYLMRITRQAEKYTWWQYTRKRVKRILIPYLVFSLIGIIPKFLFSEYLNDTMSFDVVSIVRMFLVPRENVWGHFWFLPMIFILSEIGFGLNRLLKKAKQPWGWWLIFAVIGIGLSFIQPDFGVWCGINDVLLYFWFFALGNVIADIPTEKLRNKGVIGILIVCALTVLFFVNKRMKFMPSAVINRVIGIGMILGILLACVSLEKTVHIKESSPIRQTYTVFILSWPCQLACEILLERILHFPYYVTIPAEFLVGILIPIILVVLINWFEKKTKTKFISFCLGK